MFLSKDISTAALQSDADSIRKNHFLLSQMISKSKFSSFRFETNGQIFLFTIGVASSRPERIFGSSETILDPNHEKSFGVFRPFGGRPTTPTLTSRNLFRENVDSESFEENFFFLCRKKVVYL